MLNRQKAVLFLLKLASKDVSKVQLMKWAFLLGQETPSHGGTTFYGFVPYRYGPHSFTLSQETNALIRDGLVQETNKGQWELTTAGQKIDIKIPGSVIQDIRYIIAKYGRRTAQELIEVVYDKYPWFTINSSLAARQLQEKPKVACAIYTMGYEGLTADSFLNRILKAGIDQIIDVRNNPVSRRYGFHKNTLSRLCHMLNLDYQHFPELGIPGSDREGLASTIEYQRLFVSYQSKLQYQERHLHDVATFITTKPSVLICMEANPEFCHRNVLAQSLRASLKIK